ncbi:hypothetical protein PMIN03_008286 [Paraphaeosphaeria minitans]
MWLLRSCYVCPSYTFGRASVATIYKDVSLGTRGLKSECHRPIFAVLIPIPIPILPPPPPPPFPPSTPQTRIQLPLAQTLHPSSTSQQSGFKKPSGLRLEGAAKAHSASLPSATV